MLRVFGRERLRRVDFPPAPLGWGRDGRLVEQILLYDPLARFGCELPKPLDHVEAALRDSVVLSRFDLIEVTEEDYLLRNGEA